MVALWFKIVFFFNMAALWFNIVAYCSIWWHFCLIWRSLFLKDFLDEFLYYLNDLTEQTDNFIIVGDFNIHINNSNDSFSIKFYELLDSFNLSNVVQEATHKKGHTLDLAIEKNDNAKIFGVVIDSDFDISDHFPIFLNLIPLKL